MTKLNCAGYRFPPEIIRRAIWLCLRLSEKRWPDGVSLALWTPTARSLMGCGPVQENQACRPQTDSQASREIRNSDRPATDDLLSHGVAPGPPRTWQEEEQSGGECASAGSPKRTQDGALQEGEALCEISFYPRAVFNIFNVQRRLTSAQAHRSSVRQP